MEYLMTYGWAILIIAVVLGAIYSLGLFNGATLAPRAQPGSCQVYRPNGPFTVQYMSLQGACTNEFPQYAAQLNGNGNVSISGASVNPTGSMTISLWVNPGSYGVSSYTDILEKAIGLGQNQYYIRFQPGPLLVWAYQDSTRSYGVNVNAVTAGVTLNRWVNIVAVVNDSTPNTIVYVNGAVAGSNIGTAGGASQVSNPLIVGGYYWDGWLKGSVANLQIYNNSLDANSVKALYTEGIGGAPIQTQTLAGWWPLNGNANDYSGNLNNGVPTNVVYTNQWLSGYTTP